MSSSREPRRRVNRAALAVVAATWLLPTGAASAQAGANPAHSGYPGLGRPATPKELAAWDIDVRPDFKGLPPGQGSVAKGQEVWEARCASCHGVFGEATEVFSPLVGGTTAEDVKTGRVARLTDATFPSRTTLMKVPTVSTLWDYIHRAMPWNAPKSLQVDEVYAVTAFLLNLGGVVPDDFVLSDKTMAEAQARMPNRLGMTTAHAMWPGKSLPGRAPQPDVRAHACMSKCAGERMSTSLLPDFARNAHGNLAEQNRPIGAQHGTDTTRPPGAEAPASAPAPKPAAAPKALSLLHGNGCIACHGVDNRIVGPAFKDIAAKHGTRTDALGYLSGKIRSGGSGIWGAIPMPPQALSDADANTIAQWLMDGAGK